MKIRYGMPKFQRTWSGLHALGLGLVWVAHHVGPGALGWISALGGFIVAAGMSVFVAGMIAERRDWERQHREAHEN